MTLREASIAVNDWLEVNGKLPAHILGDFVDDFRRHPSVALVQDEPVHIDHPDYWEANAYLAAMAEYLCVEVGIDPPGWVVKPEYFLKEPWFAGRGLEDIKAILIVESPVSFRRRNLFVSANAMDRV